MSLSLFLVIANAFLFISQADPGFEQSPSYSLLYSSSTIRGVQVTFRVNSDTKIVKYAPALQNEIPLNEDFIDITELLMDRMGSLNLEDETDVIYWKLYSDHHSLYDCNSVESISYISNAPVDQTKLQSSNDLYSQKSESQECLNKGCPQYWTSDGWCDHECYIEECEWDGGDCDSPCAATGCVTWWLGDGWCDQGCDNAACNYDNGDCSNCAPGCPAQWLGDEECDLECNNQNCWWDYGDCISTCGEGHCPEEWIGDGWCDEDCNSEQCRYDDGDCDFCSQGCPRSWIEDDYCDDECQTEECDFDSTDCAEQCTEGCSDSWLGDGYCDEECYNADCFFDSGDCESACAPGCYQGWVGDLFCDPECFNEQCKYDDDDCIQYGCSFGCYNEWRSDGWCDQACMTGQCDWDDGDCDNFYGNLAYVKDGSLYVQEIKDQTYQVYWVKMNTTCAKSFSRILSVIAILLFLNL